jgi:hypothetical protein
VQRLCQAGAIARLAEDLQCLLTARSGPLEPSLEAVDQAGGDQDEGAGLGVAGALQ